jgi:hypothetical protein
VTGCAGKNPAFAFKSEVLIFNNPRFSSKGNLNGEQDNLPTDNESIE